MLLNAIIAAVLGLALAAYYANKVLSIEVTDKKVEELSSSIREGSMAFLKRMYSWISVFVVVLALCRVKYFHAKCQTPMTKALIC